MTREPVHYEGEPARPKREPVQLPPQAGNPNGNGPHHATGEAHLDRLLNRLRGVERQTSVEWTALCPGHADTVPSLVLTLRTPDQAILVHCRDGCKTEQLLKRINLTLADLYVRPDTHAVLTVSDLAQAKGLSKEFLERQGLYNKGGYVVIPYRAQDGSPLRDRIRFTLTGKNKYKWARIDKSTGNKGGAYAYGQWLLPHWRGQGLDYLLIGEGETDGLAAWTHNVPYLGLPGCSMAKTLEAAHLEGFTTIYACQEPGAGGHALVAGVQKQLRDLQFSGTAHVLRFDEGIKDLCDLHQACATTEVFAARLETAKRAAAVLDLSPDARPTILITRNLERETTEAWEAVELANEVVPRLFSWGTGLGRLGHGLTDGVYVEKVDVDTLSHFMKTVAVWTEVNQHGNIVEAYPPLRVLRDMLKYPNPPLPRLDMLTEVPVLTPAGQLLFTPGYDPDSRIYYAPPDTLVLPAVDPTPSPATVTEALRWLRVELFGDFPCSEPADEAGALALLFTRFVRPYIPGPTPLFMLEKPEAGTGAQLLTETIVWLTIGRPIPTSPEGGENAEWRKRITAHLLTGQPFFMADNLHETLDSAALASVLTARIWQDRVLQTSTLTRGLPVRCTWIATANNPTIGGADIGRRVIPVRLDAKMAHPEQRPASSFRHPDLLAFVQTHRPQLLWSVLTVIQAWVAAGRPPGSYRLGSYEDWAATLSGILERAGISGLGANQQRFREQADVNSDEDLAFVQLWWQAYQLSVATLGGLPPHACGLFLLLLRPDAPLLDGLTALTEHGKKVQLAKTVLPRMYGRHYAVVPGVTVTVARVKNDAHTKGAAWRLVRTDGAGVSTEPV